MHSSRQPLQKGPDGAAMDVALHASDLLLSTTQIQNDDDQISCTEHTQEDAFATKPPPLMHFPHCRLEIINFPPHNTDDPLSSEDNGSKLEQIALPGALVRTLLSRFESELSTTTSTTSPPSPTTSPTSPPPRHKETPIQIQPHFDDNADWVFSRCLLADFTGFREDEAEALSAQGRLCCWASVVLQPQRDGDGDGDGDGDSVGGEGTTKWELGFVVQRVGVRDPGSGWCECF